MEPHPPVLHQAATDSANIGVDMEEDTFDCNDNHDTMEGLLQEYKDVSVSSTIPPMLILERASSMISDIGYDDEQTQKLCGALQRNLESPIHRTVSQANHTLTSKVIKGNLGVDEHVIDNPTAISFVCPPKWQSPDATYFDPASPSPVRLSKEQFTIARENSILYRVSSTSSKQSAVSEESEIKNMEKQEHDRFLQASSLGDSTPASYVSSSSTDMLANWDVPSHYELQALLGEGAYGCVYQAWDQKEQRSVAIKRIEGVFQSQVYGASRARCKRILREVAILSHLRHKHIVQIYDLPEPSGKALYIIMERCDTDLRKICDAQCGISLLQTRTLVHGLLDGCKYLHSAGVYHRDLKPENCLSNFDCCVKICDFNLARMVMDSQMNQLSRTLTYQVATQWYRAPEVILQLPYSETMDVWSAGCIIAELLNAVNEDGRVPKQGALFPGGQKRTSDTSSHSGTQGQSIDQLGTILTVLGTPSEEELESISSDFARMRLRSFYTRQGCGLRSCLPPEAGEDWLDLVQQMLRFLPKGRPSMAEALEHATFVGFHEDQEEYAAPTTRQLSLGFTEDELERTASTIPRQLKQEITKFQAADTKFQEVERVQSKRW